MNKKYMILGIVGFLAMVFVSAGLVNYLSNTTEAEVSVDSPLALQVSIGSGWEDGIVTIPALVGGETFTFWQQVKNNANVEINTDMTTVITNVGEDVTCADFTSMMVTVTKNTHDPNEVGVSQDVFSLCNDDGKVATVVIPSNYQADETEEYKLDVTFAVAVKPDIYQIETTAKVIA